jgi:hypothetical protein
LISISRVPFFGIFDTAKERVRFACGVKNDERRPKKTRAETRVLKTVTAEPRVGSTIGGAGLTVEGATAEGAGEFSVVDVVFPAGASLVVVEGSVVVVVDATVVVVVDATVVVVVGATVVVVVGATVVVVVAGSVVVVVVVVSSGAEIWKIVT